MRIVRHTCLLVVSIAAAAVAQTTQPAPRHHAQPTLVSEGKSIVPGRPFTVAIRFRLDPTWHVYWKDPGDSGLPPSVKWRLPPGFTAGELQFPAPEVLKAHDITNYVYHGEVALLVEITPPADVKLGEALTLAADLRWLECDAERCLAARGSVEVPVTVASTQEPAEPALFVAWRDKVAAGATFDPKSAK